MNACLVYGLIDPRSGELRYVGKSTSGLKRASAHCRPSQLRTDGHTHKTQWLRQLLAAGLRPEVEVLETHETAEALVEAEKHFIAYFRAIGCRLTNLTEGGDGNLGWAPTSETRAKMSARKKGHRQSEEHRRRAAEARVGLRHSEESRVKMSAAQRALNKKLAPWQRRLLSRLRGGASFCDQTGRTYHTQREAADILDLNQQSIGKVLNKQLRSTGGYTFRFV